MARAKFWSQTSLTCCGVSELHFPHVHTEGPHLHLIRSRGDCPFLNWFLLRILKTGVAVGGFLRDHFSVDSWLVIKIAALADKISNLASVERCRPPQHSVDMKILVKIFSFLFF